MDGKCSFLSVLNFAGSALSSQVLEKYENIDIPVLLKLMTRDFKLQLVKLERNTCIVEHMLRFAIHAYKNTRNFYIPPRSGVDTKKQDRDFMFSLAQRLGVSSLKLFLNKWEKIFNCNDIRDLVSMFDTQIREAASIPEEVVELIMQALGSYMSHGEECCELMAFFQPGEDSYKQAFNKVMENFSTFNMNTLFQIARRHWEHKVKLRDTVDRETFALIEKALQRLSHINSVKLEHIDWMFEVCTSGSETSKEIMKCSKFQNMMTAVIEFAKSSPEIILRILHNAEKVSGLLKHLHTLCKLLIKAYLHYFDKRFSDCGHGAYGTVINEMHRARLECKHYLKNGEKEFDVEVVLVIRNMHSTKKKLMKMLDVEFKI